MFARLPPNRKPIIANTALKKTKRKEPHRPTERQGNPNNENWNRYAWRRKWEETSHVLAEAEKNSKIATEEVLDIKITKRFDPKKIQLFSGYFFVKKFILQKQ
jgi:hypothetical protein